MKPSWICCLFFIGSAFADDRTTSIGTTIITTIITEPTTTTTTTTTTTPIMGTPGLVDVVAGVGDTTTGLPVTAGRNLEHELAGHRIHTGPSGHLIDDRTNTPKPSTGSKRGGPIGGGSAHLANPRADDATNITITVSSPGTENRLEDLVGHHDESPLANATVLSVIPVIVTVNHSDDVPVRNRRQFMQPGFGGGLGGGGLGMGGLGGGFGGLGMGGLGGGFGGVPQTVGFQGAQVVQPAFGGGLGGIRTPAVVDTVTVEDTIVPGKK